MTNKANECSPIWQASVVYTVMSVPVIVVVLDEGLISVVNVQARKCVVRRLIWVNDYVVADAPGAISKEMSVSTVCDDGGSKPNRSQLVSES